MADFESRIRPLLVKRCERCHGADEEPSGGLRLDSRAGWQAGGDSGPAVVLGEPDKSLLIRAVRWTDPGLRMPPEDAGGKLPDSEVAELEAWIRAGAYDPRVAGPDSPPRKSWNETYEERRNWWSLQPLRTSEIPPVRDDAWSSPVDRYLLQRMSEQGQRPSPAASPETLVRRASLVLTGLPPSPDAVRSFLDDCGHDESAAYLRLVDRLLESPHFGERFARHWLDVVRFSETHGNEWNYDVPYAWRYRDYVIRALNADVPYDQFIREHIAGDLWEAPRWNVAGQFNESAIGTAFFRFGEVNHDSCVQFAPIGYDIVDNQLDTLTKAFQAATVACARCHDHKLDAISTGDYHALLGILRSSRPVQRTLDGPEVNREILARLSELKREIRSELAAAWKREVAAIDASKLAALAQAAQGDPQGVANPLAAWVAALQPESPAIPEIWSRLAAEHASETAERVKSNAARFSTLADFREAVPDGWSTDGMGLRGGAASAGDFAVAHEGDAAVKRLLPSGLFTFALSDKLNGTLRSPTLRRTHAKVSFEVIGGNSSAARFIANNCQLPWQHQHSIHHEDWSWIMLEFPPNSDPLRPYVDLATFWDHPKFPDPIATLGKDVENQRGPYAEHAKNPRTWWGVRRIVLHDGTEPPKDELAYLARLYSGVPPQSPDEAAALVARLAGEAVDAFAAGRAGDDDVRWLDWLLKRGLVSNRSSLTPRLAELVAAYRDTEARLSLPTTMPGMADEGEPFAQPVLVRGDITKPGEAVPRGYAQALIPAGFVMSASGSGRRELAQAIAGPDNPLTARVAVNRVWQWVFGRGLVATPDDFGHMGELPSHPELLDHLAARFVAEGWSVKRLVRELVLSRAFRSSAVPGAEARRIDPENRLLSHWSARRGEAEVIRDSLLAVSGRLDPRMFGPSIHPFREKADPEKRLFVGPLDGEGRRSIYIKFQLMEPPQFLDTFNLPGGKVTQGRRESANTPAQSLSMLNDPFVLAMAEHWAARLIRDESRSAAERVDAMSLAALGRLPRDTERDRLLLALHELTRSHGVPESELMTHAPVWKDMAHLMFNLKEFIFIP